MFANKEKIQKDIKTVPSETVSLSCEVAQAKTDVKWFKDGKLITASKKFKVETDGRSRHLIVQQVEKKDAGEYTCEANGQKLNFKVTVAGRKRFCMLIEENCQLPPQTCMNSRRELDGRKEKLHCLRDGLQGQSAGNCTQLHTKPIIQK
ncbi:Obscurin, partial [Ophiophagus hannah]